ncbi:hypothetical protein EVAR_91957_1 [Eumeta japonica]|uniref:Mariner Mos1 transposase n=1 Tax=Eumeta variegata TaxID=151549 RepID=A0A4C2AFM5_EUMVA|nr:hypothetical protein EVAR_91957_1 [Eumeta japonica]
MPVNVRFDLLCPRATYLNMSRQLRQPQISLRVYLVRRSHNLNISEETKINLYRRITGVVSTYHELTQCLKKHVDQLLHWRGGDDAFIQDTQAAYEHYNSDESDDDYTFVKCSPMLMTERGRSEIETTTTRGADRADERQSAEDCGEELNISKTTPIRHHHRRKAVKKAGIPCPVGDSTEAENEDANSSGPTRSGYPPPHHRAIASSPSKVNLSRRFGVDEEIVNILYRGRLKILQTTNYLRILNIEILAHTPYSPDLAQYKFYLVPKIKQNFEKLFADAEEAVATYEETVEGPLNSSRQSVSLNGSIEIVDVFISTDT